MLTHDTILQGDALTLLRTLPSCCVNTCVTSPPYWNLRDYGVAGQIGLEDTLDEWCERLVEVFREVRRVLRDDGTLWINLGDAYANDLKWGGASGGKNSGSVAGGYEGQRRKRRTGLKPKDLIGQPWMLAFALRADGWYLRSDIVWCLSGGARVYARTQKGEMPMTVKDMVRLDPKTVQLWNGQKWTQVLGWGQNPRPENAIELTLRSGERIGCTPEHQWPTQRGIVLTKDLYVGDIIQTTTLPEPTKPRRPHNLEDGDVGWFVGMYLAEGSRSDTTIQIAGHQRETERYDRLCRIAASFDGTCRMHKTSANGATINLYGPMLRGIIDTYVAGKTAKDKHLTMRCWQRSNAFLLSVIEGYLAGDGHYDHESNRWRLGFTRNYALEADLRTIAARLGAQLTLNLSTVRYDGRDVPTFRGEMRFERSNHWNVKQRGEIVAIGRSKARQFWDITVEDDPHLFALASGVLTHNCKPNPMPESVTDRPTKAHEYLFLLSKSPRYYYDAAAIREPVTGGAHPRVAGRNSREYVDRDVQHIKVPDGWETGKGAHGSYHREGRGKGRMVPLAPGVTPKSAPAGSGVKANVSFHAATTDLVWTRNKRSVWTVATAPFSGAHFATFPPKLIEPCILAGSPAGGVVLDPFMGAGTVGVVARRHSRHYLGVELNPAYVEMAEQRIAAERQPVLWSIASWSQAERELGRREGA